MYIVPKVLGARTVAGGNLRCRVENPVQHRLGQPEVRAPRHQNVRVNLENESRESSTPIGTHEP